MKSAFGSLNATYHLPPHEKNLTIALINIHYLYNELKLTEKDNELKCSDRRSIEQLTRLLPER